MGFKVIMVVVNTIDGGVEKKEKKKAKIQITWNFLVIEVSLPI